MLKGKFKIGETGLVFVLASVVLLVTPLLKERKSEVNLEFEKYRVDFYRLMEEIRTIQGQEFL